MQKPIEPLMIVLVSPTSDLASVISTGAMCLAIQAEGQGRDGVAGYLAEKQGEIVTHRIFFHALSPKEAHLMLAEMLTDWAEMFDQQHVVESLRKAAATADADGKMRPYTETTAPNAPASFDRSKMN